MAIRCSNALIIITHELERAPTSRFISRMDVVSCIFPVMDPTPVHVGTGQRMIFAPVLGTGQRMIFSPVLAR